MTYEAKERSIQDGAPLECYKFEGPSGDFRYTNGPNEITLGGELYLPLAITRETIEVSAIIDTVITMDFQLPYDCDLARLYCGKLSPTTLNVTVYRAHHGDDLSTEFKIEWQGEGLGTSIKDKTALIQTGSIIQARLAGNLSSVFYQRSCNHALFDARCKVNKATYTTTATVTKVQGQQITVDNDDNIDAALVGGTIKNTRTGEERAIGTNLSNVLRIGYRFIDIIVGDTVELTLGCDHARLGHCKNRFNNVVNYGGFDFVPLTNPYENLNRENMAQVITNTRKRQIRELNPNRTINGQAG